MDETTRCEKCDLPLTGQAMSGMCANCLLKLALEPPVEPTGMTGDEDPASEEPTEVLCFGDYAPEVDAASGSAAPQETAGSHIGRYTLQKIIGKGGFGTVWRAEQNEPVQRLVALKIIRIGMDTREFIARFEQERQALAMMDHPNIARVLDGGTTPGGRPYFVMELVPGVTITKFCDQQKLPLPARLELFIEVCRAIQHAHQKGIIHRDIKPSNVMVTLDGDKAVPKVIDFGIAKATQGKITEETVNTRFEQFIGTPVYMSPEQAAMVLDIDTRTDIYALGILLYELLTGKPPFDAKSLVSAGYEEMRRIIREVEPPKPSSKLGTLSANERTTLANARKIEPGKLSRMVEPDLDWIVMKAIEKDRSRRYETVNGLALDIQRFLADEPVSATPPSAAYKFRKFARRNKTALRVGAGFVVMLVAATIVSSWQAVRATEAGKLATKAENLANDRLVEKDKALKDAEAISTFLGEVFQSPDPSRNGRTISVAESLDGAVKKLETGLADQPSHRSKLQFVLGRTYHTLGLYPEAILLLEKARDYVRVAYGPEHEYTLETTETLAMSCFAAHRRDEALKLREETLPFFRKTFGPEHHATLNAMGHLAASYAVAGRQHEALNLQEDVLTLKRKVLGPEHQHTLSAMGDLAVSYVDAGRREEALKLREEVLTLSRKVNGPEHPDALVAMLNLSISWFDAGRREEALKLREELLTRSRKVYGPELRVTPTAMTSLAGSYFDAGRREEAAKLLEDVMILSRRLLSPENPGPLAAMHGVAGAYAAAGQRDEAIKVSEEVLALKQNLLGAEHRDTLAAMQSLAKSCADAGRMAEAIKLQGEALEISRKVNSPEHHDTLTAMSNLGSFYHVAGRNDEALKLREEVLALSRTRYPEHPGTLTAMTDLAISYGRTGQPKEALKMREEVLPLSRKFKGPEHPGTLGAMTNLAISYGAAGRLPEAIKLQEQSLAIKRRVLPPSHPYFAAALQNMANLYEKDGRKNEALSIREESLALSRRVKGAEHPDTLNAMTSLVVSHDAAGRLAEAIELQEEALAITRRTLPRNQQYLAVALGNLAELYGKDGRKKEAAALLKELSDQKNP